MDKIYLNAVAKYVIKNAFLKKSKNLELNGLKISLVNKEISDLFFLQEVNLSCNNLKTLPSEIGNLKLLNYLNLSNNEFNIIPESIFNLSEISELNLSNNYIKTIPNSIKKLKKLKRLNLSNNLIEVLPQHIWQLPSLEVLNLNNNQISDFADTNSYFKQIVALNLQNNKISVLPDFIVDFNFLEYLNISNNLLKSLPKNLGNLSLLKELHIEKNFIKNLPNSIGDLRNLKVLNIKENELKSIPKTINKLNNLEELFLPKDLFNINSSENSNRQLKESALSQPKEIFNYYFELVKGSKPLNEAKLILIGRGAVGKTSIVNRLLYDTFNNLERKTDGINILDWNIELRKEELVKLNIWDFGGQEIMHATHQFFLTQRSIYLLVVTGREGREDEDVDYWLRLITSFGGTSPIIIVLNKIKEHPFDLNRGGIIQKYPSVKDFVKTDCKDGYGINKLISIISKETNDLDHLRDDFPLKWFNIKNNISRLKKNFLSFSEYRILCAKFGEGDYSMQDLLATYLHNLGIALNYKDDPRLEDTHILNPRWVTNGIYKIINDHKLEKQKGIIEFRYLKEILKPESEYPIQMIKFIMDLMKKFELCFSFPNDENIYLIPELLDKQQPEETNDFNPNECLNFQYRYPILTEGLISRFIVRTSTISEGLPRWRTGVILKFEDCLALVNGDIHKNVIYINVKGPLLNRRRLLAIIRSDFERIHYDIKNLNPLEEVPVPSIPNLTIPYNDLLTMEKNNIGTVVRVYEGNVLKLDVEELLNGIDINVSYRRNLSIERVDKPLKLFYSYSHRDENLRNELEIHLKLLQRQGLIQNWHDRKIIPGSEFSDEIDKNINEADIILVLLSADFINSDYCYNIELKNALIRHQKGEVRIVPIILRDFNKNNGLFESIQYLPKNGLPVTLWENRDSAWRDVCEGIEKVVYSLKSKNETQKPVKKRKKITLFIDNELAKENES